MNEYEEGANDSEEVDNDFEQGAGDEEGANDHEEPNPDVSFETGQNSTEQNRELQDSGDGWEKPKDEYSYLLT
ncbi:hypothetical protein L1987_57193 [Smallanthus sonchifolius]|uniref:Uncharacterized protein n=1 Tax=Smallanthus sonchifolius TaxID=185202 RepID=A0ACB9DCT6_9ASTR|nr:hypothetical protein L1987_57193 [Smallanthus sonchifolius]